MVQKIGAQYLVKRISDYVTAPPATAESKAMESTETRPTIAETLEDGHDLDGEAIRDDDGQVIGIARRIRNIAVYVISDTSTHRLEALQECVDDPESRVLFQTVDGRLAGLIYVPDPEKAPPRVGGFRADDI
jgi:hypothetical protein